MTIDSHRRAQRNHCFILARNQDIGCWMYWSAYSSHNGTRIMPDALTVDEFVNDTLEDVRHPEKSNFISKISSVRCTVYSLDEGLETDRNVLIRSKKLVKSVVSSGIAYAEQITALCDFLERLGQIALEGNEPNGNDIAASLCKFSVVHRDLANMTKHLMQNLNSIIVFPMETFMQGDIKSDLKKPFEKALKDYEYKYDKLKKEKLQMMKETGCYAPEAFTEGMTKDLEKERRRLQLETCEYLIKVNELKAKRSADLLQHLIDFFYVQTHYLRECLGVMDHFGKSMNDLASRVNTLHKINDVQKRRLVDTREEVRGILEKECDSIRRKSRVFGQTVQTGITYAAQPTQVNRAFGTRKSGFLLKKSDGKVKRVWQRRRVRIADGELWLYHADETKPPVRLTLLTCQVKLPMENVENDSALNHSTSGNQHSVCEGKLNFDLVSNSRTYNFQAEDEQEYEEWISVLNNAMQEEFNKAMNGESSHTSQYDLSDSLNLSSHRGNSNNNNSITNGGSLATGFDLAYSTLTCQGNNPAISSKHVKSDSFGDSLPGSENDLLDSNCSQASRSRESHLDNVDAISTDAVHPIESKGRPSKGVIQSSLRFYASDNEVCADCSRPDPEWVSVNLGILICLECCGAHRELGVHYSRTQSLLMDELSTNQLLLPRFIGNQLFNSVFESSLPAEVKPNATDAVTDADGTTQRRAFIKSKYVDRRFITKTTSNLLLDNDIGSNNMRLDNMNTSYTASVVTTTRDPVSQRFLRRDLLRAVKTGDLPLLIQVYAERLDLMTPFEPEDDDSTPLLAGTTALHIAVETTNKFLRKKSDTSFSCLSGEASWNDSDDIHEQQVKPPHCNLPLVEFIIQNALPGSLKRANELGDTALHHAARYGCVDALKLLVQAGGIPTPILQLTNKNGQTALDIVEVMLTTESNPSEIVEAYKSCQQILKLADLIASSISSNTNRLMTDSICSLFPNTDGSSEKISMHRANLSELLDQLNSVNWCHPTNALSPSTASYWAKSGKYCPANKRVTTSSSSTITTPGVSTAVNTTTTTTASEAFSSKLGYFSLSPVIKTTNQSVTSSPRDINSSKTTSSSTGKQITFEEDRYATSKNVPMFNKPIRSFSQYSPSAHYGSVLATLPRKKGPAPRPPSISSQPNDSFDSGTSNKTDFWSAFNRLDISRIPSSPSETDKQLPSDHIDIILDVLEERPTISTPCVITSSSPAGDFFTNNTNTVFTSRTMKSLGTSSSTIPNDDGGNDNDGITTSPPIPPKPSYISNTLYSTLPSRSLHVNRTSSVSVNSNLPTVLDSSSCLTSSTSTPVTKTTTTTSVSSSSQYTDSLKSSLSQHINDRFGSISSAACIPASITASLASKSTESPSKLTSNGNSISVANCKVGDLLEALYDCEAENSDELTFSRGEIIQICDKPDDDWWEGVIHSDKSRRGMFPVTYVKPYHHHDDSNDND